MGKSPGTPAEGDASSEFDGPVQAWRLRWLRRRTNAPTLRQIMELARETERSDGAAVSSACVCDGYLSAGR